MPAVMDLPTLDALRDEQRSLRAQLARLRAAIAPPARPRARDRRGDRPDGDGGGPGLPRLAVSLRSAGPSALADALSRGGSRRSWAFARYRRWRASRLDELSLAVTLDRYRPGVGQQIADVLQLPDLLAEPGASASPAMVRLAVQQACAALAESDWRSLWNRKRTALHAGALLVRPDGPAGIRPGGPARGSVERRALAAGFVRALAAADLSHRDGARCPRPARGPARRTVPDRGAHRPAADRSPRRPVDRRRPR